MINSRCFILAGLLILSVPGSVFSQTPADTVTVAKDWFLRDPETDKVQGLSVEKAYATLLKNKPSRTITVAVIDSGVDFDHKI